MLNKRLTKLIMLNFGVVVFFVLLFSKAFLGITLTGTGTFMTAFGISSVFLGSATFIYGNYVLLNQKNYAIRNIEMNTTDDCVLSLKQQFAIKTFRLHTELLLKQIERFNKKKSTIQDILLQRFNSEEMSYNKFTDTVNDVEKVFFLNIRSVVNKINAFDEEEYTAVSGKRNSAKLPQQVIETKRKIYEEYINFADEAVADGEDIILKLDKLLLEISGFNSFDDGEIENMDAIKELDKLIGNAKWYRNSLNGG